MGLLEWLYPQGWQGGLLGMGNAAVEQGQIDAERRALINQGRMKDALTHRVGDDPLAMALGTSNIGKVAPVGKPIRAYHASPHDFDKFDMSKIGTGQGAQSYGHGFYVAESPSVSGRGGSYDREFTARKLGKSDLNQAEELVLRLMGQGKGDLDILRELGRGGGIDFDLASSILDKVKANKSHIYEVNLHADPSRFLDWDKPLREMGEGVRRQFGDSDFARRWAAAYNSGLTFDEFSRLPAARQQELTAHVRPDMIEREFNPSRTGASIYDTMGMEAESAGRADAKRTATEYLQQAGIPGIKYLDQGSRAAGEGSRNYVVFDPKIIEIIRKYGLAGLGLTGAGMLEPEPQGLLSP